MPGDARVPIAREAQELAVGVAVAVVPPQLLAQVDDDRVPQGLQACRACRARKTGLPSNRGAQDSPVPAD